MAKNIQQELVNAADSNNDMGHWAYLICLMKRRIQVPIMAIRPVNERTGGRS